METQSPLETIFQSERWATFQKSLGRKSFQIGRSFVFRHQLPFGKSWLYCPRGPMLDYSKPDELQQFLTAVESIAKQENAIFLRIDPMIQKGTDEQEFFEDLGFRYAHAQYQPEATIQIDLRLPETEILAQMKEKGRYNIKVAERHGVTIRRGEIDEIPQWYELFRATAKRDRFSIHPLSYYQKFLEIFRPGEEPCAELFLAEKDKKIIGGIIVVFYHSVATYLYGASSYEHRSLMAPYLLQWEAMREARRRGYTTYDLFGIAPGTDHGHKWAKLNQFKEKFGGKIVEYLQAQEYVYQPFWYAILRFIKRLR